MSRPTTPNRLKGTFNAITAAAALFCAVFMLLAVQMVIGNDPAIGAARSTKAKAEAKSNKPRKNEGTSWQALLNRAADAVDVQSPASEQTYSAPQQYVAPAPVQSSTS